MIPLLFSDLHMHRWHERAAIIININNDNNLIFKGVGAGDVLA